MEASGLVYPKANVAIMEAMRPMRIDGLRLPYLDVERSVNAPVEQFQIQLRFKTQMYRTQGVKEDSPTRGCRRRPEMGDNDSTRGMMDLGSPRDIRYGEAGCRCHFRDRFASVNRCGDFEERLTIARFHAPEYRHA